jgi:hypothetical protein
VRREGVLNSLQTIIALKLHLVYLIGEVPDPVQRASDDLAEVIDLAVVRATELRRQDQISRIAHALHEGEWLCVEREC